jgi:hypothetical protein
VPVAPERVQAIFLEAAEQENAAGRAAVLDRQRSADAEVCRLRPGDTAAAERLMLEYESVISPEVHSYLGDRRLRRAFDSMDVCQAVPGSLLVIAAAWRFERAWLQHLLRLLKGMARKKLLHEVRRERAVRRDVRRVEPAVPENRKGAGREQTPSRVLARRELLQQAPDRLSPEERDRMDRRAQGHEWGAIAAELGGKPEGRAKHLGGVLDGMARQLGLDDFNDA